MSLSLPTFATGAAIDASVMMDLASSVRLYVNEGMVAGDRAAAWMVANHVYAPDFFNGANPHTTLTSGETYFRQRGISVEEQSFYSFYLGIETGASYFPIPGLCGTIQIPENINTNGNHRVRVFASLLAYEFGGIDGPMNETTGNTAMVLDLVVNGTAVGLAQPVYKGSSTSADEAVAFYPKKQVTFLYSAALNRGVHNIGVGIKPYTATPASPNTKHCIIVQGNIVVRYYLR